MSASITRKKPSALVELGKWFKERGGQEIAVGFPSGTSQAYPDGTRVVDVAASHVFGVGVPRRDFMSLARPQVVEKTKPILEALAKLGEDEEELFGRLQEAAGQEAQEAIKEAIISLQDPPNSPATIAAKGSSNPLIDTGHMKDSVTYAIRPRTR